MKIQYLVLILLFVNSNVSAQNLIPNPGFEENNEIKGKWMFTKNEFDRTIQHWSSPNDGSPDILFEKVLSKMFPLRKHVEFDNLKPASGKFMLGIKTFGCLNNTQHCREYAQVKLSEPIRKGEKYAVEFYCATIKNSIYANNLGLAFSDVSLDFGQGGGLYFLEPIVKTEEVIPFDNGKWEKVSAEFVATENATVLVIGNFFSDEQTKISNKSDAKLKYAYYLIDDVSLIPLSYVPSPTFEALKPGDKLVLENIFFESGKAILKSESNVALEKLATFLMKNKNIKVSITGFTDDMGTPASNLALSFNRAKAVCAFLMEKGISNERLIFDGKGEQYPIADNLTKSGRQQNRRVELNILE